MYSLQSLLNYCKCSWRVVEYFCGLSANLQIWSIINFFFFNEKPIFSICCCFSVAKSCLTHCDLMNCSMPGFCLHHYLHEFPQIHVHWISDVIQPAHPLSPLSPLALNLSQHQGLFEWVSSLALCIRCPNIGASTSVLPMNIQGLFPLGLTGLISLLSKGFSRVFSSTTIWKHQFFHIQPSSWSNSHMHTWLLRKP